MPRAVVFVPHRDGKIIVFGEMRHIQPMWSRLLDLLLEQQGHGPATFDMMIAHVWPDADQEPAYAKNRLFQMMARINQALHGSGCQIKGVSQIGFELHGTVIHDKEWTVE